MAKRVKEKAIARQENADKRPSAYLPNVRISVNKVCINAILPKNRR